MIEGSAVDAGATRLRWDRHPFDLASQAWMMLTSRPLSADRYPWLLGPSAGDRAVGHGWVDQEAAAIGGRTRTGPDLGVLPDFTALASSTFNPALVHPLIVDFYEHTSRWQLDLWSEWCPFAWPFGWLLTAMWSHRLQQLSLPMRPLDVSWGMDSEVVHLHGPDDRVLGAAWLRTMRKTGLTTYSGLYGIAQLPNTGEPSVRVVFPLPRGCLSVFLRPSVDDKGALHLHSPIAQFGDDGAYLVLNRGQGKINARRIPIAEHFHLYADAEGHVRTDHFVRLWNIPTIRLHYRLRLIAS
ncbi:MAG: hypothetical protein JO246_16265 [Frankiaceae bacterium]|nr:hypothetical protein [Frankiaceae bacterium]MBV9870117.1 hypothetical protein [Frankiaceae bacterium]